MLDIDGVPVFETAAILGYIDDVFAPVGQFRNEAPLLRARNRAWILFGLEHLMQVFSALMAKDKASYDEKRSAAALSMKRLEAAMGDGPFFGGEAPAQVDFVYAAFFLRQEIFDRCFNMNLVAPHPKLAAWSRVLLERPSTRAHVLDSMETSVVGWLRSCGSFVASS